LLLLISGIGLLFIKRWAVMTLWVSLLFSFILSTVIGHSWPAYTYGNFQIWFVDLILAIFLSIEWKKSKVLQ
jgi:hypothetical protein